MIRLHDSQRCPEVLVVYNALPIARTRKFCTVHGHTAAKTGQSCSQCHKKLGVTCAMIMTGGFAVDVAQLCVVFLTGAFGLAGKSAKAKYFS